MNDAELENHLRGLLRPASPSAELRERIDGQLQAGAARSHAYFGRLATPAKRSFLYILLRDFGWACAGAAAALAVLAMLPAKLAPTGTPNTPGTPGEPSTTVATANTFEHDETTNELVATQDSEQVVETDDGPAREVRYSYLERHEWSNPATGARVYLEVPREDVYLVPVALQ
jgi:hypothetical protein